MTRELKDAPKRIWLSATSFNYKTAPAPAYIYNEQNREPNDIEYVRADVAARELSLTSAQLEAAIKQLDDVAEGQPEVSEATIYCEQCGEHVPLLPIPTHKDNHNPRPWGDIVCPECHFVIASITAPTEGVYQMIPDGGGSTGQFRAGLLKGAETCAEIAEKYHQRVLKASVKATDWNAVDLSDGARECESAIRALTPSPTSYNAVCPVCESPFGFTEPESLDAMYQKWETAIRRECRERAATPSPVPEIAIMPVCPKCQQAYVCEHCGDLFVPASPPVERDAVPDGEPRDAIQFDTLLEVLARLRSTNRNPKRDWYLGWNAALDCLINDIRASTPPPPVTPQEPCQGQHEGTRSREMRKQRLHVHNRVT